MSGPFLSYWFPLSDIRVAIEQIWKPDLLLYNSISDSFDSNFPSKAVINNKGVVLWIPPAIVDSACEVNVQYFPFDEQKCDLSYGPWTHDITRMDVHNTVRKINIFLSFEVLFSV